MSHPNSKTPDARINSKLGTNQATRKHFVNSSNGSYLIKGSYAQLNPISPHDSKDDYRSLSNRAKSGASLYTTTKGAFKMNAHGFSTIVTI